MSKQQNNNVKLSETEERFTVACRLAKQINTKKAEETEKGKLYGLYKQSTVGDCNIKTRPNKLLNYTEHEKWGYWKIYENQSKENCMNVYADYVVDLIDKYGLKK